MPEFSSLLKRNRGFTVLEISIVLVITGLMLVIGSSTLPWFNQERFQEKTRGIMAEASNVVLTFSLTNNRLPCPADPALNFGDAFFGDENCTLATGVVPHEALLLSAPVLDASHRMITYSVYQNDVDDADLTDVSAGLFNGLDEPTPVLNEQDFCAALKNANSAEGVGFTSTSTSITTGGCIGTTFINQAFVLSSSGLEDADGDTEPFDGYNIDGVANCFASPDQGRSALYDDLVFAVSFDSVLGKVCS